MPAFFSRVWVGLLLVGLAAHVITKGVMPALTAIDADFAGYYVSARIVSAGQDVSKLYDDVWFREQVHRYGAESPGNSGKFAPFPPPTALLLLPLASYKPLTALRIVTGLSVLCLLCSMLLLSAMLRWRLLDSALFVLVAGDALLSCLQFGQPYIIISTCCLLGYYLYREHRPWAAGLCTGLFIPIKYYPVVVLAGLALHKEWKVVLGGCIAIAAVALLSVGILGWKIHQIFLLSIFSEHLIGHLSLRDVAPPFTAVYQSFDTLFNRWFIPDPVSNPHPLLAAPALATFGIIVTKAILVLLAMVVLVRIIRNPPANAVGSTVGIIGMLVMLIAPATATYTCVLLWLPVALLIEYFLATGAAAAACFLLAGYAVMGFLPYARLYPFEGRGGLTVLAYPRLFLLLALFLGCVQALNAQLTRRPV
jgi:Glycosyltransferase family 87